MISITKKEILDVIQHCEDEVTLQEIATVLNLHKHKLYLSNEMIEKIKQSQVSVSQGKYYTKEEAIGRLSKWVNK